MNKISWIAVLVALIIISLIFLKENKETTYRAPLKEQAVILAFGDSLTYGYGAPQELSYPSILEKKTGLHVINAGVNGEESSEGLRRLPTFLKQKPDLVILCHGGNDIIGKLSKEALKKNLLSMIQLIQESGAEVLLVGVPNFGMLGFQTDGIYYEIADETDVMFEDKVLSFVEQNNIYKSDYIHPNAKGYEMMADAFIDILQKNKIVP